MRDCLFADLLSRGLEDTLMSLFVYILFLAFVVCMTFNLIDSFKMLLWPCWSQHKIKFHLTYFSKCMKTLSPLPVPTAIFGNFHKISMAPRIFSILTESLNIQYIKNISINLNKTNKKSNILNKRLRKPCFVKEYSVHKQWFYCLFLLLFSLCFDNRFCTLSEEAPYNSMYLALENQ